MALAILELAHPVSAAGAVWLPLHILLTGGYGLLTWLLWQAAARGDRHRTASAALRVALIGFVLANTIFLVLDGVVAAADSVGTNALWGNVTGATWCLVLLCLAAALSPAELDRPTTLLLILTWVAFIASATPLPAGPLLSRAVAVASAAWLAYRNGVSALPSALLVFGSVLRQHVGPEATLGLLLVAAALGFSVRSTRRSAS